MPIAGATSAVFALSVLVSSIAVNGRDEQSSF